MGASRKWIKSLMGTINSKKVSPEGKYKDVSQGRGKGWGLLKSSKKIFTKMERQGEEAEAEEGEKCSGQDMVVTAAMVSAMASTEAAGAAVAAAGTEEAMVRVHLRNGESVYKKDMEEEWAAITIQTAFRCLMARRALRALKGFARLQALVRGHAVRKQTANTLKCMQAMVKIQTRVHANQVRTLHLLKLQQKEEYPHPDSEGRWCDGVGSIQDIQDKARQKQEAVLRRERALAYAYSTQKRASSKQQSEGEKQQEWGWIWLQNCVATNIQTNSNNSMKDSSTLITKKSADHSPTTLSFINNNHNSSSTARRACSNPKQRPHATPLVDTLPLKKRYSLPADARPPVAPATVRKLRMFPKPSSATAVSA